MGIIQLSLLNVFLFFLCLHVRKYVAWIALLMCPYLSSRSSFVLSKVSILLLLEHSCCLLGCVWIKDLVRKTEKERKKLEDLKVLNGWILHFFHFRFPHQILDPNATLKWGRFSFWYRDLSLTMRRLNAMMRKRRGSVRKKEEMYHVMGREWRGWVSLFTFTIITFNWDQNNILLD